MDKNQVIRPAHMAANLVEATVVGGHAGKLCGRNLLYKPADDARGAAEEAFYDLVFQQPASPLALLVPRYWGAGALPAAAGGGGGGGGGGGSGGISKYLVLEDLTAGYARPCVLDVKMGAQTWAPDAPAAKAAAERDKWLPQQALGFRVTGMRVWLAGAGGGWAVADRGFGYSLAEATAGAAVAAFLHDGARVRTELVPPILAALRRVEAWFEAQADHAFYGSSLLFVYEGEPGGGSPRADVRMIDFAHVWPLARAPAAGGGAGAAPEQAPRDWNYLAGLRSLIGLWQRAGAACPPEWVRAVPWL